MLTTSGKALLGYEKIWEPQASIACRKYVIDHTTDAADPSSLCGQDVHLTACVCKEDDTGML